MRSKLAILILILSSGTALAVLSAGGSPPADPEFTSDFGLEHAHLVPNGGNEHWTLRPGAVRRYEGNDDGELVELEIKVLSQIRPIVFRVNNQWRVAFTRVIREKEWIDGELVEISRNYFARDTHTQDIFYFGEEVDIYEDGEIVSHDGAWLAGHDGAQPGLIMPGRFLLGSRYYQEVAPDVALDRARHAQSGLTVNTPAGSFTDCVKIVETTPLEPGSASTKIYAPGIGLIADGPVKLISYED